MDTNHPSLKYKRIEGDDEDSHVITEFDQMRAKGEEDVPITANWVGQTVAAMRASGILAKHARIWTPIDPPKAAGDGANEA